jgi:GNAT superfamily N-acetyltransferase
VSDASALLDLRGMRDEDRNYVLSSWLRSYAAKGRDARDYVEHARFFDDYAPIVRSLLDRSQVIVASLREEPDVIVGWASVEGDALHYVLVKPRWRRLGVARWMLNDFAALPVAYTHRTSDAMRCPIPDGWSYRRFRVWPREKAA